MLTLAVAAALAALHIAPVKSGSGDGSNWENAGGFSDLPAFVEKAKGRPIWLRADAGPYETTVVNIRAGGDAKKPLVIQGVDANGRPADAELVGTRATPYKVDGPPGGEVFRLAPGADHLKLSNLLFKNQGMAVHVAADIKDLTIENVRAENVRRFLDTIASGKGGTATVTGLVVRDVQVTGYSKAAIRLRYDTNKVLIEDVVGDSQGQDGDNFAMGVHLGDTVHDVTLRRVTMKNHVDTIHGYWNGDGFASERGTYDIRLEDTLASGNTDGGYDMKSRDVTLVRTVAEDNKHNYRLWQGGNLTDVVSRSPKWRGGTGGASHFWLTGTADTRYVITRPKVVANPPMTLFEVAAKGPLKVEVAGGDVPSDARKISVAADSPQPQIEFKAKAGRK